MTIVGDYKGSDSRFYSWLTSTNLSTIPELVGINIGGYITDDTEVDEIFPEKTGEEARIAFNTFMSSRKDADLRADAYVDLFTHQPKETIASWFTGSLDFDNLPDVDNNGKKDILLSQIVRKPFGSEVEKKILEKLGFDVFNIDLSTTKGDSHYLYNDKLENPFVCTFLDLGGTDTIEIPDILFSKADFNDRFAPVSPFEIKPQGTTLSIKLNDNYSFNIKNFFDPTSATGFGTGYIEKFIIDKETITYADIENKSFKLP